MASLKTPFGITHRVEWLRSYYFKGADRPWTNEYTSWTTGTSWDSQFSEITFYIVPEVYTLLQAMGGSFRLAARPVVLRPDFWELSLPERRACGQGSHDRIPAQGNSARRPTRGCPLQHSNFALPRRKMRLGISSASPSAPGRQRAVLDFHNHGYGNAGATSGH